MYEFNETKDKITERELVSDILSRVSFGKNVLDENDIIRIKSGTKLTDTLLSIIHAMPNMIKDNYIDAMYFEMTAKAGTSTATISTRELTEHKLIYAMSSNLNMDITECIEMTEIGPTVIFTYSAAIPFTKDDVIKIYAK